MESICSLPAVMSDPRGRTVKYRCTVWPGANMPSEGKTAKQSLRGDMTRHEMGFVMDGFATRTTCIACWPHSAFGPMLATVPAWLLASFRPCVLYVFFSRSS